MFPLLKIGLLAILMLLLECCVSTGENSTKKNSIDRTINATALLITASSIINPAIGFGTIIANTTAIQKAYSAMDLANMAINGETIAETVLSHSTKKNCKLEHIIENQNICL